MNESKKSFRFSLEETVPTYTIGAAFTLAVVMGLIVVSGVLLKPYEAREVVESIHEKILMEKEYRELSRISYSVQKTGFSKAEQSSFPETDSLPEASYAITLPDVATSEKTDRAHDFDRQLKSDEYWKHLQASIAGIAEPSGSTDPVVLPVVVGSAE